MSKDVIEEVNDYLKGMAARGFGVPNEDIIIKLGKEIMRLRKELANLPS